ncbi:MAG: ATP-binding domain-containing protein [Deltaproteobacteria bacterium]|nr:ATP-binding domain-containing protein [Deltaproteobacteria bacterium]
MKNTRTHAEEQGQLKAVQQKLRLAYEALSDRAQRYAREAKDQKTYLWENRSDMDHAEKVSTRLAAQQIVQSGEVAKGSMARIAKLIQSPWFGRIDFRKNQNQSVPLKIYVGIHTFQDAKTRENLIYDWRAPVSTMFYDYELGPAKYNSPMGIVEGELELKRQFRIRNGQMEFVLESGLNIMDDVLQEELSRTSDDRMKNIVATIQRDQNAIIRNEDAPVLIIQGVAGSGKTSIALHRIAFLLYRHKDTLTARDILIISPNKVFGDFISNVLPELGEEQIPELGMEQLADELLERKVRFQSFVEQTNLLLEKGDDAMRDRIAVKSTVEFMKQLDAYIGHIKATRFTPTDIFIGNYSVPAGVVELAFNKRADLPLTKRIKWTAEKVKHEIWVNYRVELATSERAELKRAIGQMTKKSTLRAFYKDLFAWMEKPHLFKPASGGRLEYTDVFPLIYLKMHLEGVDSPYTDVKHLLVDEMQDYTPIQYAVLSSLFDCEKTILGDAFQSVNPYSSSRAETIGTVFPQAESVQLHKSYRSSYEITQFANAISPNTNLIPVMRHGSAPQVIPCKTPKAERAHLLLELERFTQGPHRTLGIICRSQKQTETLHTAIIRHHPDAHLLTAQSTAFEDGITICTAHLSKGLEFDHVVIPEVTHQNYVNEMEKNLLYVACTRAMHRLTLTHSGTPSTFIPKAGAI